MASNLSNTPSDTVHLPGHAGASQLDASQYYGQHDRVGPAGKDRHGNRARTYSSTAAGGQAVRRPALLGDERVDRPRRLSHGASCLTISDHVSHVIPKIGSTTGLTAFGADEHSFRPRKFLIDVEETMRMVLEQEDTDNNFQIAVTDTGPKVLALGTLTSNGYRSFDVRIPVALPSFLR